MRVTGPILWPLAMLMFQRLCLILAWPQAVVALPKSLAELSFALKFTVCFKYSSAFENFTENLAVAFPTKYQTLTS